MKMNTFTQIMNKKSMKMDKWFVTNFMSDLLLKQEAGFSHAIVVANSPDERKYIETHLLNEKYSFFSYMIGIKNKPYTAFVNVNLLC